MLPFRPRFSATSKAESLRGNDPLSPGYACLALVFGLARPPLASFGELAGFAILPIEARHAAAVETLPQHHGDPFDRLLICQAQVDEMVLVTADHQITRYAVPVLSAVG